ncbi:MAG: twin-arginine translocation pathway signal protein, partial [Saprospiraceae bacterium]
PDDHDVYHGNIWGNGGVATPPELGQGNEAQDAGGYKMPAAWVNMVQRTQTSHLPDPFDPAPVAQGIGVYFTSLEYAGISFAILEDRKFKPAPAPLLPEAEIDNGWPQNKTWDAKKKADVDGAVLLGERQLQFLGHWAQTWGDSTRMKVALSQTIFANVATLPASEFHDRIVPKLRIMNKGEYPPDDRPVTDFDSNGWPQTGRNEALRAMRKAFALHIAGDQHLGSVIQYGVDNWRDAGYAFCVPAVSNIWPRRWYPREGGRNRSPNAPRYTGDFEDGFGNKMAVLAVSNPIFTNWKPSRLYDRATGYGIIRLNKKTRDITLECWPRSFQRTREQTPQYPGWPVTFSQFDNYRPQSGVYLPELHFTGIENPVVQVLDAVSKEIIFTVRISGTTFRPEVPFPGKYVVRAGWNTAKMQVVEGVETENGDAATVMEVRF